MKIGCTGLHAASVQIIECLMLPRRLQRRVVVSDCVRVPVPPPSSRMLEGRLPYMQAVEPSPPQGTAAPKGSQDSELQLLFLRYLSIGPSTMFNDQLWMTIYISYDLARSMALSLLSFKTPSLDALSFPI